MNFSRQPIWVRLLIVVIVLALAYFSRRLPDDTPSSPESVGDSAPPTQAERPPAGERGDQGARPTDPKRVVVDNVIVKDLQGRVAYRGTVDLTDTIARIRRGARLDFRNDGAVFENRERRLPGKPRGYYHEFVHPTPELSGPGPQRVVTGSAGEFFYTADHYRSFRQLTIPAKSPQR